MRAICLPCMAFLCVAMLDPGHSPSQEAPMRQARLIGTPIKAVVYGNSHGVLARSPQGRDGMFYIAYYSSTGGALIGYEAQADETVTVKLPSSGGYGCTVGTDGALYIGGIMPGNLYRYGPGGGSQPVAAFVGF